LYRWLQGPDPELQSVKDEIAHLKTREVEYLKILQAAASIPPPVEEKDWSESPFYSHTLKSLNFASPADQMGLYVTTLTGIGIVSKALWRSYNIRKAYAAIQMGIEEDIGVYLHRSGLTEEKHVCRAMQSRYRYVRFAFGKWAALVASFTAFVQLKNRNDTMIQKIIPVN
jgi:hypothetical protein